LRRFFVFIFFTLFIAYVYIGADGQTGISGGINEPLFKPNPESGADDEPYIDPNFPSPFFADSELAQTMEYAVGGINGEAGDAVGGINGEAGGAVGGINGEAGGAVGGISGEADGAGGTNANNAADSVGTEILPPNENPAAIPERMEINDIKMSAGTIVGIRDGVLQPETDHLNTANHNFDEVITEADLYKLKDMTYLRQKFYIVDPRTEITPDLFDVDKFMREDLTMVSSSQPKVLIFHSHSQEMFVNSTSTSEGIIAVGTALADVLANKYGILALHNTDTFDLVDGKHLIEGAYERMEPVITEILRQNPSIEMVIDLHRDGFLEGTPKQVVNINGKETAVIMLFNGISQLAENGEVEKLSFLPNNYLNTNLALSFRAQLAANAMYPGFTKKIYLNAYRYSLHMMPKSLFVEVGSQFNTKEEAVNSAQPLADIIARVVGAT
jgi:stage II sporulation protein P